MTPYYQDSAVTIYHGDCRELIPELSILFDLVLTDPPFETEAHTPMRRTRARRWRVAGQPMKFLSRKITDDLRAFVCDLRCNWLLAFCQAEAVAAYQVALGSRYVRPMVWIKPDSAPQFTGDRPAMGYESIVCAWCSSGKKRWNGGGKRGVFEYNATDFFREHPTQKPLKLIQELITLFSLDGMILDPFMGSGTTLRAAKNLGYNAIGIEIEECYCEIAAKRMAQGVLALSA